jgi:anti-anti-sigma factor
MADTQQLSIVVEQQQDRTVIQVRGEVDLATAPALAEALAEANSDIVVDLAELAFMDASGLQALGEAGERAQRDDDRLTVIHASPLVRRMFELTGLAHLLAGSDAP